MHEGRRTDRTRLSVMVGASAVIAAGVAVVVTRQPRPDQRDDDVHVVVCPEPQELLRAALDHGARLRDPPHPDGRRSSDPLQSIVLLTESVDGGLCQLCVEAGPVGMGPTGSIAHAEWTLGLGGWKYHVGPRSWDAGAYEVMSFDERQKVMLVGVQCATTAAARVVTAAPSVITEFTMTPVDGGWRVDDVREFIE